MPALAVAIESMIACWDEMRPLTEAHWDEVVHEQGHRAKLDRQAYEVAEQGGGLLFLTARDAGRLVGYVIILLVRHPHATGLRVAEVNALYLDPAYRRGFEAQGLVGFAHAELVKRGIGLIYQSSKINHDIGPLLRQMGYAPHEILWCKHLHPSKET